MFPVGNMIALKQHLHTELESVVSRRAAAFEIVPVAREVQPSSCFIASLTALTFYTELLQSDHLHLHQHGIYGRGLPPQSWTDRSRVKGGSRPLDFIMDTAKSEA
jgi:hypothetical protein